MILTVDILVQEVYGKQLYYPQCSRADTFARISKTKTLDIHQLAWIEKLGFEIRYFAMLAGSPVRIERNK